MHRADAETYVTTSSDFMGKIVQDRLDYLSKLAEAEELKRASDDTIRKGINQGYTMYAIAKKLHMSESAIAYIRDQGK